MRSYRVIADTVLVGGFFRSVCQAQPDRFVLCQHNVGDYLVRMLHRLHSIGIHRKRDPEFTAVNFRGTIG